MTNINYKLALLCTFTIFSSLGAEAKPSKNSDLDPLHGVTADIPATKFILQNGLTLIVNEDNSSPLIAVNIWYHVGSKDELKGKSGFAHLFEHIMFNGSENFNDDFFKATQKIGAISQNGTTNVDRTNYYQIVPKSSIDSILWLESDRMGNLLGALDQSKLDEQRAVVKNEKRQNDNYPYSMSDDLITNGLYSSDHPYGHSTIGSIEDIDSASLQDVKSWFRKYYGPSNAVIVLSGDISPEIAKKKVEKYFGNIDPGQPVSRRTKWLSRHAGTIREIAYDRVPQARIYRVWSVPGYASTDAYYLQLLGDLLANGPESRLVKTLVRDKQMVTEVWAGVERREIAGQFFVDATLRPGVNPRDVEAEIDAELTRLLAEGPKDEELTRVKSERRAAFARSLESIAYKAHVLAENETFLGSPDAWKMNWDLLRTATTTDLRQAGKAWLSDGDYVLNILPFGNFSANGQEPDRSAVPTPEARALPTFPKTERSVLSNGLELIVAQRTNTPTVNMTMLVNSSAPIDFGSKNPAAGYLAMVLMNDGSTSRTGEQLTGELTRLGGYLEMGGGGDQSTATLSSPKPTIPQALEIFADVLLHPGFRGSDVARVKSQSAAAVASARGDTATAAARVFPVLIHGASSPDGRIVTEADVAALSRDDLIEFHSRWFRPNNSKLIIVGDTTLEEIKPLVERAFAKWKAGAIPNRFHYSAPVVDKSVIYLLDRPDAPQSIIRAAVLAPDAQDGREIYRDLFNKSLGGGFTSRLNMKLREENGWAYDASSSISGTSNKRLFTVQTSVQTDKTSNAIEGIIDILDQSTSEKPLTESELTKSKDNIVMSLTGQWTKKEEISSFLILESISRIGNDYFVGYPENIMSATLEDVNSAGFELIKSRPMTWIIVGDLRKIEQPIRSLQVGEVHVINVDGDILR